jgi:hypothetical protein
VSSRVPRFQTHLLVWEGSDVATCHMTLGLPLGRGGLQYHHVSHGFRPTFRCRRTLTSPHVSWHQARHLAGEGSGVATSLAVPDPPPGVGGLCHRYVSRDIRPAPWQRGLWRHHVSRGTRPAPRQGRALVSHGTQHAMGHKQKGNTQPVYLLSWVHLPPRCACAFLRRLTSGSS